MSADVNDSQLVIVGGGLSSAKLVAGYREAGGEDRITLVSADPFPPYHRPPLSKRFLRGEAEVEDTYVQPAAWYQENGVDLRLETHAERVEGRELVLADGSSAGGRLPFDRLVLATGAEPRRLPVPGADGEGVFVLRSLTDSSEIRHAARDEDTAVAVGAGFIGMEVAASLTALGLKATIIEPLDMLFPQFRCRELSDALVELYRQQGVEVLLGDSVAEFRGDGHVAGAVTKSGRELRTRLAVVGIGVVPRTQLAESAGAEVDNGIVVNERFETTVAGVYAVGDVANYHDPVFGRRRRIEHWSHANYCGAELGQILAGKDGGYNTVSTFFSEVFGRTIKVFGDSSQHDELVVRGDFRDGVAVGYYLERGRIAGAVLMGQDEETENRLKEQIRAGAALE